MSPSFGIGLVLPDLEPTRFWPTVSNGSRFCLSVADGVTSQLPQRLRGRLSRGAILVSTDDVLRRFLCKPRPFGETPDKCFEDFVASVTTLGLREVRNQRPSCSAGIVAEIERATRVIDHSSNRLR